MLELVYDPDAFVSSHAFEGDFRSVLLVVTAASLSGIGGGIVLLVALIQSFPPGSGTYLLVGYVIGLLGAFLGPFVEWALVAMLIYGVSSQFGGSGRLPDLVQLIGWGYVPVVVGGLVTTAATVVALNGSPPPADPEVVLGYVQTLRSDVSLRLAGIVGIGLTFWSGAIWTVAVEHARDIPRRDALVSVAVPVCLLLAWRLHHLG